MIVGTIRRDAQPILGGIVRLPRLGIEGKIDFLVDTGAADSMMHPGEARLLRIDYSKLTGRRPAYGVGGQSVAFQEHAHLLFHDEVTLEWYDYPILLVIAEPSRHNHRYPSLLGRDVLRHWRTVYDPTNGVAEFHVV